MTEDEFNHKSAKLSEQYYAGELSFSEFATTMLLLVADASTECEAFTAEVTMGDAAKQTAYKTYQRLQSEADQMFTVWLRA